MSCTDNLVDPKHGRNVHGSNRHGLLVAQDLGSRRCGPALALSPRHGPLKSTMLRSRDNAPSIGFFISRDQRTKDEQHPLLRREEDHRSMGACASTDGAAPTSETGEVRTLISAFRELSANNANSVDGAPFLAHAAQSGPLGARLVRFFAGQAPRATIENAELTFAVAVCCSTGWKHKAQLLCSAVCAAAKHKDVDGGVSKPELFVALSLTPGADALRLRLGAQPALKALLERAFAGEEGGGCSLVPGPGQAVAAAAAAAAAAGAAAAGSDFAGGGGAAAAAAAVACTHLTPAGFEAWIMRDSTRHLLLEVESLPPLFTENEPGRPDLDEQFSNLTTAAAHPAGVPTPTVAAATYAPSTQAHNVAQHMRGSLGDVNQGLFNANTFQGQCFDSDQGGMVDRSPVHPRCDDPAQLGFVGVVVLLGAINTEELAFTIIAVVLWQAYLAKAGLGKCGPSIGERFRRMVRNAATDGGDAGAARLAAVAARERGWTQSADTILAAQLTLGSTWQELTTKELFVIKAIDCSTGWAYLSPAKMLGVCLVEFGQLRKVVLALPPWMRSPGAIEAFRPPTSYCASGYTALDPGFVDVASSPIQIVVSVVGDSDTPAGLRIELPSSLERVAPGWHSFEGASVTCDDLGYAATGCGSVQLEQQGVGGDTCVSAVRIRYACKFGHFDMVLVAGGGGGSSSFQSFQLDARDLCYCACIIMHSGEESKSALEICRQTHTDPEIRVSIAAAQKLVSDDGCLRKLATSSQLLAGQGEAGQGESCDKSEHEYLVLAQGEPTHTPCWGDPLDLLGFPRLPGYCQEMRRLADSSVWRRRSYALSACAGGRADLPACLTASFSAVEVYLLSCGACTFAPTPACWLPRICLRCCSHDPAPCTLHSHGLAWR